MLTLAGVEKSFGGRTLFSEASLQLNRGDRLGLVGPNGAGKSTLFNLILGEESVDKGKVERLRNLDLGFLPQESLPVGEGTVLELALSFSPEYLAARGKILNIDEKDGRLCRHKGHLAGQIILHFQPLP